MLPKIPDDIYDNRCKYCMHHIDGKENRDIKDNEVYRYSDNPCVCNIQSIAGYKYQKHDESWHNFWYVPYEDGECRSFVPHFGYPICNYCKYYNQFHEKQEYCTTTPKNRKIAVIGRCYGNECWKYAYMVCDKWQMSELGRHNALEKVAEGKLPQCFDPKTFKLLNPTKTNSAAEEWERIIRKHNDNKRKIAAEKAEREKTDENGQYKLWSD